MDDRYVHNLKEIITNYNDNIDSFHNVNDSYDNATSIQELGQRQFSDN